LLQIRCKSSKTARRALRGASAVTCKKPADAGGAVSGGVAAGEIVLAANSL
jgi:hypothetical protein